MQVLTTNLHKIEIAAFRKPWMGIRNILVQYFRAAATLRSRPVNPFHQDPWIDNLNSHKIKRQKVYIRDELNYSLLGLHSFDHAYFLRRERVGDLAAQSWMLWLQKVTSAMSVDTTWFFTTYYRKWCRRCFSSCMHCIYSKTKLFFLFLLGFTCGIPDNL